MPRPVSRREFIRRLRELGWEGPYPGGRHDAMRNPFTGVKVPIPNPHRGDIDWSLPFFASPARAYSRATTVSYSP